MNTDRSAAGLVPRIRGWLAVGVLLGLTGSARAAGPPPAPPAETVRLANGTVLVGQVLSRAEGRIRMLVAGVGEVTVDSTALAPATSAHGMMATPSPWSGNLSVGVLYVSAIAPGIVGTNLGVEISSRIARTFPHASVSLDGTLGYSRIQPVAAETDRWGLTLGSRHELPGRWMVLATSRYEVDRVQTLRYRWTTLAGLGYQLVKTPAASLIVAPGLGYSKSEQTPYGRILSFGNRQPPGVDGAAWGAHDMLMLQLAPTIMLEQQLLWLSSLESGKFRQAQLDVRLTGAVTSHVKMLIVYGGQYDSSMPAPVNKTVQSLNSGVQVAF